MRSLLPISAREVGVYGFVDAATLVGQRENSAPCDATSSKTHANPGGCAGLHVALEGKQDESKTLLDVCSCVAVVLV